MHAGTIVHKWISAFPYMVLGLVYGGEGCHTLRKGKHTNTRVRPKRKALWHGIPIRAYFEVQSQDGTLIMKVLPKWSVGCRNYRA